VSPDRGSFESFVEGKHTATPIRGRLLDISQTGLKEERRDQSPLLGRRRVWPAPRQAALEGER
jgi:hypothetical protein